MASTRKSSSAERRAGPLAAAQRLLGALALRDKTIAVGFSGGADSTVLLHVLRTLAPAHGYRLRAVHVHHGISPNADAWARFCRKLCRDWRVPLSTLRVDIGSQRGKGLEAAARDARRAALARVRADVVALAHQLDDQAETVLLRLLRGAGVRGASAMPSLGRLGAKPLLRPLLEVPRAEVIRYAQAHGLQWVDDESNRDPVHARNFLRLRVAPLLEERYPRWRQALGRAAQHFSDADALLREFAGARPTHRLRVAELSGRPAPAAGVLLREYLAAHGLRPPATRRLAEMLRQLTGAASAARVEFAHDGAVLRVYRGELRLERLARAPAAFGPVRWTGQRRIALPSLGGEMRFERVRGAGVALAKLRDRPVQLRLRRGGERLQPDSRRPRRTLKNLFQEAGLPPWQRDRVPLLFCGEDLVWVPGIGVDVRYRTAAGGAGLVPQWYSGDDATH
ncbi:MAG TPA: tRNA lysidine(34) synthetase TilS [Burkholderiales bacterium]|nr:tRNA lysidine(34) synthetase TilS [Burkholderiales bacterium]